MANGILLQSGEFYDYENLSSNKFTVHDIALSLSNICRYGGQVDEHYSVAQHSVLCSMYVKEDDQQLAALMHDAAEAFLGDIPTPLKNMLPEYKKIEARHEADIFRRLGLEYPMHPSVKAVDRRAMATEVDSLKRESPHWEFLDEVRRFEGRITPWSMMDSYVKFMDMYSGITGLSGHEIL